MEELAAKTLASLSVRTVKSVRQQVVQPLRRPAPDRGDRQGRAVEQQARHPGRADRRAGRGADRAGARAGPPPGRQAACAVVLISHNMNDVFAVSDSIAALYLGQMAAQVRAAEVTHSQVVELITAGRSGDLGLTRSNGRAANGAGATGSAGAEQASPTTLSRFDARRPHRRPAARARGRRQHARSPSATSATTCAAARWRDRRAAGRDRRSSSSSILFPILQSRLPERRTTSRTCSPRARRSPSSPWAWCSCCCSARSTCRPATPPAPAPRSLRQLMPGIRLPWYVAVSRRPRCPAS